MEAAGAQADAGRDAALHSTATGPRPGAAAGHGRERGVTAARLGACARPRLPTGACKPLSPSDLGGAKALPGEADPRLEALATRAARPCTSCWNICPATRSARLAHARAGALVPEDAACGPELLPKRGGCSDDPALAALFAPDSAGRGRRHAALLGGQRRLGTIDRLIVTPDRVLAVDFKSNRLVPQTRRSRARGHPAPDGRLCRAAGADLPGPPVETAILWTGTAQLMPLAPRRW